MSVNIEEVAALVANGIIEFEINNPGDRIFWTPEDVRRYSSRYGFANEIDGFAGLDALKEGDLRALNKRIAEIMTAAIDPLNTRERAAVEDIYKMKDGGECDICKHYNPDKNTCAKPFVPYDDCFEWRGPQEAGEGEAHD